MFNRAPRIQYELTHEHNGGQIPNHHRWYIPGRIVYRHPGNVSWMVLECENPNCLGEALVKLDSITGIPLGVVWPDPEGTQEKFDDEKRKQREAQ